MVPPEDELPLPEQPAVTAARAATMEAARRILRPIIGSLRRKYSLANSPGGAAGSSRIP